MRANAKLTPETNPTLWNELTRKGAPKPLGRHNVLWNDWAANNPTPAAIALGNLDVAGKLKASLLHPRGILGSAARPVEN